MKIGILGSGNVGQALAKGLLNSSHTVMLGSRDPKNEKMQAWLKEQKKNASVGTLQETVKFGDIIIIAVPGSTVTDVITAGGKNNFSQKIVIDISNPLDFSKGFAQVGLSGTSNGEIIQKLLPKAYVVKTLDIIGAPLMVNPQFTDGTPDMLVCGNDAKVKKTVEALLKDLGWERVTDLGPIEQARLMESLCALWITYATIHKNWHMAFSMLEK